MRNKAVTISSIVLCCVLVIASIVYVFISNRTALARMNVGQHEDNVRVALGTANTLSESIARRYRDARERVIIKMADTDPYAENRAILVFSEFMDYPAVSELAKWSEEDAIIDEVYFWIPGETGRASTVVMNNDVEASVLSFMDEHPYPSWEELRNNGKAFAVTVTARNDHLALLASFDYIFADPFYSEEDEALSERTGKAISYICIPDKPDGTG